MKSKPKHKTEAFTDGIVTIYDNANGAAFGNIPRDNLILRYTLRFRERIVGIKRYYAAMEEQIKVDRVIRCPRRDDTDALDAANIGDKYYRIVQVQYPEDISPPVMDLSLERTGIT